MRIVLSLLFLCIAAPAWAGIPCELLSAYTDGIYRVAVVSPAGTAPSLADQGTVIHVEVFDCTPAPVENFPYQDIWISDPGTGELWLCQGGSVADANTDANGHTTISGVVYSGGHTETGTLVFVAGIPVDVAGPLPLDFVSPDIDGDGDVDIQDFSRFGQDFGTSALQSDLVSDGLVDLADFGAFGRHFGEACP
jgi:hypothetical protein